jgi:hypothetical protein
MLFSECYDVAWLDLVPVDWFVVVYSGFVVHRFVSVIMCLIAG